jgi:hypothetical protein
MILLGEAIVDTQMASQMNELHPEVPKLKLKSGAESAFVSLFLILIPLNSQ